jgi:hypothetical protein
MDRVCGQCRRREDGAWRGGEQLVDGRHMGPECGVEGRHDASRLLSRCCCCCFDLVSMCDVCRWMDAAAVERERGRERARVWMWWSEERAETRLCAAGSNFRGSRTPTPRLVRLCCYTYAFQLAANASPKRAENEALSRGMWSSRAFFFSSRVCSICLAGFAPSPQHGKQLSMEQQLPAGGRAIRSVFIL